MYFARLAQLKPAVEQIAAEAWEDFEIGGEGARRVERVLDVRQGELCWVVGTIYMEMPLKPNILDDLSKEHWITAPPPRIKYLNPDGKDQVMLEDESGRLRLTGKFLQTCLLVTGCIIAVVGTENADGDFEALDVKVPDLARQPQRWEKDDGDAAVSGKSLVQEKLKAGKVAVLSGLEIDTDAGDAFALDLLLEYLLGESSSPAEQEEHSRISRLIIAGNSLAGASPIPSREEYASFRKNGQKRTYGYDQTSYDSGPTARLDTLLTTLLPSMPITMLPGDSDPTQASLPQQPIHPAMFPESRSFMAVPGSGETGWLDSVTNPWEGDIDGWRFMGNGGQPVDDIYKYVDGEERLEMIEAMLRWRLGAPTAPDTLCMWIHRTRRIALTVFNRVLPLPRCRRFRDDVLSACLLRRQSAQVRD